jgi:regulatory LuxR family protein
VLRLLAAGHTNAQIGAELYISPKTASVHVTSILRKLGVSGRVQAAALAERAGLLRDPRTNVHDGRLQRRADGISPGKCLGRFRRRRFGRRASRSAALTAPSTSGV